MPAELASRLWWIKETYLKLLTTHSQTQGLWGRGGKEVTHSSFSSGCRESGQHQAGGGQRCPLAPWRMVPFVGSSLLHQETPVRHQCYAVSEACLHRDDDISFGNWMLVHIQPHRTSLSFPLLPDPLVSQTLSWTGAHQLFERQPALMLLGFPATSSSFPPTSFKFQVI